MIVQLWQWKGKEIWREGMRNLGSVEIFPVSWYTILPCGHHSVTFNHTWTLTLSAVFHISPSLPWSVSSLVFKLVKFAENTIWNSPRQHQHQQSTSPPSSILSLTSVQDLAMSAPIAPVRFYSDPASLIIVVIINTMVLILMVSWH